MSAGATEANTRRLHDHGANELGSHVTIDPQNSTTQIGDDPKGSLTWGWLATPDAIGQWEISLNVAATGSSPKSERALTIPINAYRFENHCCPV